jgi:hypothetical protein
MKVGLLILFIVLRYVFFFFFFFFFFFLQLLSFRRLFSVNDNIKQFNHHIRNYMANWNQRLQEWPVNNGKSRLIFVLELNNVIIWINVKNSYTSVTFVFILVVQHWTYKFFGQRECFWKYFHYDNDHNRYLLFVLSVILIISVPVTITQYSSAVTCTLTYLWL